MELFELSASIKDKLEDEGIQARNLIKFNVPLHVRKKVNSITETKSGDSEGLRPECGTDTESDLKPVLPLECGDVAPQQSTAPLTISTHKLIGKSGDYRARYWGQMMDTLKRTIDEIYSACETDESEVECKEVIMILEHNKKDFYSLIEKMNLFKEIENSTSDSRPCCIAWDERKISPGKPIMRQVLEKSKRAHSFSGQSSTGLSQSDVAAATSKRSAAPEPPSTSATAAPVQSDRCGISKLDCTWADKVKIQLIAVKTQPPGGTSNRGTAVRSQKSTISSHRHPRGPETAKSRSNRRVTAATAQAEPKSALDHVVAASQNSQHVQDLNEWAIVNRTRPRQGRLSALSQQHQQQWKKRQHTTLSDRPSRRGGGTTSSWVATRRHKSKSETSLVPVTADTGSRAAGAGVAVLTNKLSVSSTIGFDLVAAEAEEFSSNNHNVSSGNDEYELDDGADSPVSLSHWADETSRFADELEQQVYGDNIMDNDDEDDEDEETDRSIIRLDERLAVVQSKEHELQQELGKAQEAVRKTIETDERQQQHKQHGDKIQSSVHDENNEADNEEDDNDDGYDVMLDKDYVKRQALMLIDALTRSISSAGSSVSNLLIPLEDIQDQLKQQQAEVAASGGSGSIDWSQVTDDTDDETEGDDSVTKLRTPGRCVDLHQKLSAPLRKRSVNSIQQLEEKQAKAKEIREKILQERTEKVRELTKKVEEVRMHKSTLLDEKKNLMEQRLNKAETKRQQQLDERVKKAHDEEMKGKEIAFIQSLEAAQKQHTILTKHQESEARLLERQEERKKKMEEKAEREAAAEDRRKKLETNRQAWLKDLQQKWKSRDENLAFKFESKERQRRDAVKAKEAERESKKSVLEQQHKTHIEQLKEKISKKHEDSERRHQEQLAEISRKAFEMSVTKYSAEENSDAPGIEPYLNKKWCKACNVMIDSDILLQSHLNGKKHKNFVKEQLSADCLEMDQIKKFNLEHLVDAPDDKTDPKIQAKKERRKNVKKKLKKVKQRILVKTPEFVKFCEEFNNEEIYPATLNKQKYVRFIKETRRILEITDTGPWVNVRVTALEKSISDIFRSWESLKNVKPEQHSLLSLGVVDKLCDVIQLIISQKSEQVSILPEKTLLMVLKNIKRVCHSNSRVCCYMVYSPHIVSVIDALQTRLQYLIPDNFLSELQRCNATKAPNPSANLLGLVGHSGANDRELPTNTVVESLMETVTAILDCFIASCLLRAANCSSSIESGDKVTAPQYPSASNGFTALDCQPRSADVNKLQNIISYIISIGIVDKLSDYLSQVRGPLKENSPTANFVLIVLYFLSSLLKILDFISCPKPSSSAAERAACGDEGTPPTVVKTSDSKIYNCEKSQLLISIEENEMCGLICLMYGLLLYQGNSEAKFDPLPNLTGKITIAGLNLINNLAVVSLQTMQNVLSQECTYLQLRHILSFLIAYCHKYMVPIATVITTNGVPRSSGSNHSQDTGSRADQPVDNFSIQELLHEVILCIGHFCVSNLENQNSVQTGQRPTILQQLCQLPFPYFSQRPLTQVLFPTLISCCYDNTDNKAVVEQEMTCDFLASFIQDRMSTEKISWDNDSRFYLQRRFPPKLWESAKDYFNR